MLKIMETGQSGARGSAPNPAFLRAYSAPLDPLAGGKGMAP